MSSDFVIRDSRPDDMAACQRIFSHYVASSVATFEEVPPDADELGRRRQALLEAGYPHLVAVRVGEVAGYAYAGSYRPRPAYRFTVEDSLYVSPDHQRRGLGRALLSALIARCEAGPWRQMLAVVTEPGAEGSMALHEAFGFRRVGCIEAVGFKLGSWRDTVTLQRALGPGATSLPA